MASGKKGTKATPSESQAGEHLLFGLSMEQVVLVLHAGEAGQAAARAACIGLGELRGGEVGTADLAYLALHEKLVHRHQGLRDRHLGVGPVQQVEVDVVASQPAQALRAGLLDPFGMTAGQTLGGLAHAELGGDHDALSARAEGLPQELLGSPLAVTIGRIEVRHAHLQGGRHDLARAACVKPRAEVVAAQPGEGDLQTADASPFQREAPLQAHQIRAGPCPDS